MSATPMDRLLTGEELADRWQLVGKRKAAPIWRLSREGKIPPGAAVKIGKYWRYSLPGIEEFEAKGGLTGLGGGS